MKTLERETLGTPGPMTSHRRWWWELALVAVLALVLGAAGGWALRGSDEEPAALLVGGGKLTERQEQMVAMVEDYRVAWGLEDRTVLTAMYAPTAKFVADGTELLMSDGTLANYLSTPLSIGALEPMLVDGNKVSFVHVWAGRHYSSVMTFTGDGELLVTQHVITS